MLRPSGAPKPLTPFLSLCEGDLLGGRYRLEAVIAARPSIVHYAATDLTTGTRVSAHVLVSPASACEAPDQDSARAAFLAGARQARELTGPHVARVLDAGVTFEGHPWVVREHLASATVAAHLRRHGALPTSEAVDVALAVCDALAEAHGRGLVHGSLGPHAVHVAWSASGLVDIKVTGLGTASAEAELSLGSSRDVECILRAPEQLRDGHGVDARADVWAVGLLLHTMLAGAPPFSTDTPSGASLSVILDDPPSLAGVPDELAEAVERALSKDPSARPKTVLELADSIVWFASHPDIARDRITARRPAKPIVPPADSDPTLIMHPSPLANAGRRASSIPPSVQDVVPEPAIPPPPRVPFLAPRAGGRDQPTVLVRRPEAAFPRRRMLKYLGAVTAAASVALLVLVGTEGARLSRTAGAMTNRLHQTVAATSQPAATPDLEPAPPPPVVELADPTPEPAATPEPAPRPAASARSVAEPRSATKTSPRRSRTRAPE